MTSIKITCSDSEVEFGVMSSPYRKNKYLYKTRGVGVIECLAYFRNEQCAEEFCKVLDFIYDAWKSKETKQNDSKQF